MACPTCGGMFANNTKFFDHIRRQTALDRKLLWAGEERVVSSPLAEPFGLLELLFSVSKGHGRAWKQPGFPGGWELRH